MFDNGRTEYPSFTDARHDVKKYYLNLNDDNNAKSGSAQTRTTQLQNLTIRRGRIVPLPLNPERRLLR